MNFFTWKKFFFWVCLFPTILKTHKLPSKTPKFGGKSNFHQNHQKSTKIDFVSNFCDRSLEYLLKYLEYDFWGHTTFFDKNMRFWTKTIFEKKKKKALSFQKIIYIEQSRFCIKSALKNNCYCIRKKKKKVLFVVFFKNFFVQNLIFCQKKSYDLKNHTQGTSGGTLKICRRNLKKINFCDFWWFWWKTSFLTKFWDLWGTLLGFKMVGNRQTQKKKFFSGKKIHGEHVWYLKYASKCQIDAIFVIKIF